MRSRLACVRRSLQGVQSPADCEQPHFKHWDYLEDTLWAKPIITHEYSLTGLPGDDVLCDTLGQLCSQLIEATGVS